ncbi:dTDP-4-dehydrorhamnose reductase [Celeribacter sp.]|uniref:dTDP-4-dehydrorhamnose reductase n=1 Tax=Celeribacter sp. TaxID=1890673 RepID=UPI003A9480B9
MHDNLLIFGKTGQVATELRALLPEAHFAGRDEADLTGPAACADLIARVAPAAVINAAAYTAVDKAEDEAEIAHLVNASAPTAMAEACAARSIPFVHISTDYVFDGSGERPFAPDDTPAPLGVYGRTKLAGEEGVVAAGGSYVILRTSWVFSAHGSNFVKTMLRLGAERDALSIVADQIGGPTPARQIADACPTLVRQLQIAPEKSGIYHFSGAPDTTWADFARAIFEAAGLDCAVTEIATADYPTPAARPLNSRLDCTATEATFGITRPDWRAALTDTIATLKGSQ